MTRTGLDNWFSVSLPGGGRAELRLTGQVSEDGLRLLEEYIDLVRISIRADEVDATLSEEVSA